MQEGELKTKRTVVCCSFCQFATHKKRKLFNAFFQSQFSYSSLVSMRHSRTLNNKVKRLHEKCLRMIFNDKHSTFHEHLKKDCSISIYTRNLKFAVTEMYKLAKGISPTTVNSR